MTKGSHDERMVRGPLHQELYDASHEHHRRLDTHPLMTRLLAPNLDQPLYVRVLKALWCGLAPVEQSLLNWEAKQGAGTLPAYLPRLPSMETDLASLGVVVPQPSGVTWCLGDLDSVAAHAGVRYVLDGACLGSVTILKSLDTHEWLIGSLAFWRYQAQLAALWPRVTEGLAAMEVDSEAVSAAAHAARSVFDHYYKSMQQECGE